MKIIKGGILAAIMMCVALWAFAVAECEINTLKLKDEIPALKDIYGYHDYNKVKVLYYNNCYACVYACTDYYGNIYHLKNEDYEHWEQYAWECVWSRSGSADDFIWPYGR